MSAKNWLRGSIVASLLALPLLLSGCSDPPISGPGGGPSSGASGSTNASGANTSGPGTESGGGTRTMP